MPYQYRYVITINGESPKHFDHNDGSDANRIYTTWVGLEPEQTYQFTVECKIQGEDDAPGTFTTYTASTSACSGRLHTVATRVIIIHTLRDQYIL